jgi:acyl carrier protein
MPTIEERIKPILAAQFCKEIDEIDLSANIAEKYESDSLDLVEVTMTVEDEFGIEIPDDDMFAVKTGQQLIDLVRAKVPA